MERIFQICTHCGVWRETTKAQSHGNPLQQLFVDYDHRFFLEEHLRCPYPSKSLKAGYGILAIRESDTGFQLPTPDDEWKPEKCFRYKPPSHPSKKKRQAVVKKDLVGWWITNNIGGMEDEAWGFHANGSGTLAMLRLGDFHRFAFKWQLKSNHRLSFALSKRDSFRGFLFFFEGIGVFKVTDEINEYGEKREILTIQSKKGEIKLIKKADDFLKKYMERMEAFQPHSKKNVKSAKHDITRIVRWKR